MNDLTPFPSRLMKAAAAAMRGLSWLLIAVLLLMALSWGTLHGWIVPRIGDFRPRLEKLAGQALGVPVRIGQLRAQSTGLVPSFELRDVALLDQAGREALRLPRVVAALSVTSVMRMGFEQIFIDEPELDIRRSQTGKILIAGLDFGASAQGDVAAADWFFSQKELVIRGGTARWTDEQRDAPTLALAGVDFVMRNGPRHHDLRLDATPPPGWGDRFVLMGQFRRPLLSRHAGRWQDWSGQLHADFARVDVSQLRRHASLGDIDVSQGQGALRVWADVHDGQMSGGVADVALAEVTAVLGKGLEPLALRSVRGRLGGDWQAAGFRFHTEGLRFDTRDGLQWPGGNVQVAHMPAEGRTPAMGELRADRLDLAALNQIAHRLPLGAGTHNLLQAHPARGLVETVQARWQGPLQALQKYEARGRVVGLDVAARPAPSVPAGTQSIPAVGVPGVRGATIDFDLNQSGGRVTVAMAKGALELPGIFEDPMLLLDRLNAEAQWQVQGERIVVQQASVKLANADAEGEFSGSWQTSDPARSTSRSRFPGVLDLQGSFSRADGTRVHRYLPLGLPDSVRHYVRDAVQQGSATGVAVRIKGDLWDVPFADAKQGEFRFAGKVQGVTLAYVPRSLQGRDDLPWPALADLSGELVFDRKTMRVGAASASVGGAGGLKITRAEAQIDDLTQDSAVVVTADARGPASGVLEVVNRSPLSAMTGQVLGQATATGDATYRLQLNLPLDDLAQSRVQGSVTLAGNDVQITPDSPLLARARGVVSFSEKGFAIAGGQARMLGGDVRVEGGSRSVVPSGGEASVVLRAQGTATAEGLRQARGLDFVSRLAQSASGSAAYSAVLAFRQGRPELSVTSNLQGLALALPPPLNKSAETTLPMRVENTLVRDPLPPGSAGPGLLRDHLMLELGRVASVQYVRDLAGPQPRVLRGSIAVGLAEGESAPLPEEGVVANISFAKVDFDAWEAVLSKAAGASVASASPAPSSLPAPVATAVNGHPALGYLPTVMAVRARELTMQGRTLHNVVVGGSREGLTWRANVDASELNGYVEYRQPSGEGAGRVYARLARLTIAPSAVTEVEALLDEQPQTIPALDITVDDLELRGKKLGRVEIEAINRGASAVAREGGAREWRLNKFNVILPEASLVATGHWAEINAQAATAGAPRAARETTGRRRTVMNFKLDMTDAGALLARFGMKDVIRRGKGQMQGQIAWAGSPLALHYPSMSGQFNVNVDAGQFLKADPGLAKLLGVLSLQSLPRRLTLDFRDVFSEGFAFDFIRGDVGIAQGMATTNNLQMKGVNAAVLMEGRADIARETQDLRVVVVPEINAGTASLVATVINPAIGLGTFLAQMFLRRPLIQAATQEFHIDGTWTDPRITKVVTGTATDTKTGVPQ